MILENESSLQRWLSNQLRPISDADPLALAMYVVALLKHHDKKGDVLKNHCYEQLLDFLKDHTRDFLESLFNVLKDGSYKVEGVDDEFDVSCNWIRAENAAKVNIYDHSYSQYLLFKRTSRLVVIAVPVEPTTKAAVGPSR